jgi:hypothetical protein
LEQLPGRYPQRGEMETRLRTAAEELSLGDRALQTVEALVRVLTPIFYTGRGAPLDGADNAPGPRSAESNPMQRLVESTVVSSPEDELAKLTAMLADDSSCQILEA